MADFKSGLCFLSLSFVSSPLSHSRVGLEKPDAIQFLCTVSDLRAQGH